MPQRVSGLGVIVQPESRLPDALTCVVQGLSWGLKEVAVVIYYHTYGSVFGVKDGYCSSVLDHRGQSVFPALLGCKLKSVTTDDLLHEFAPEEVRVGLRLKFSMGDCYFISGAVENWEIVGSLSIPPNRKFSVPPDSRREQVTLPEILALPTPSLPPDSLSEPPSVSIPSVPPISGPTPRISVVPRPSKPPSA